MEYIDSGFSPFECTSPAGLTIRGSMHSVSSEAPMVIFCHGFTGHRLGPGYLFIKMARTLFEIGYSSLRFDFTGAAESEGAFFNMNTTTMIDDLTAVVAAVRMQAAPRKLILCGHSFGGMIAARKAGELNTDGLILLAPVGDPTGLIRRRKALLNAGPNPSGFYENGPHEMSITFLDSLTGFDPVAEMKASFTGQLLVMQGDSDLSIALKESRRYVDAAHDISLAVNYHVLAGCDHNFLRVSDVRSVLTTVATWMKESFGAYTP